MFDRRIGRRAGARQAKCRTIRPSGPHSAEAPSCSSAMVAYKVPHRTPGGSWGRQRSRSPAAPRNGAGAGAGASLLGNVKGQQLRCLTAMPATWACDCSKRSGFRCGQTPAQAIRTALSPRHNEFYNILTDLLPMVFFFGAAAASALGYGRPAYDAAPSWLRHSFLLTTTFTAIQHLLSLFAHTFSSVSAQLSHTVWLLDYVGIALNFVNNAPAITFVSFPELSYLWPCWLAVNLMVSAVLIIGAAWLVATCDPSAEGFPSSLFDLIFDFSTPGAAMVSATVVGLLFLPNGFGTIIAGFVADWRCGAIVACLFSGIVVKQRHIPERWLAPGRLDLSVMHSHCVWHFMVWALQVGYMVSTTN